MLARDELQARVRATAVIFCADTVGQVSTISMQLKGKAPPVQEAAAQGDYVGLRSRWSGGLTREPAGAEGDPILDHGVEAHVNRRGPWDTPRLDVDITAPGRRAPLASRDLGELAQLVARAPVFNC